VAQQKSGENNKWKSNDPGFAPQPEPCQLLKNGEF
jgi:hypothetical protein